MILRHRNLVGLAAVCAAGVSCLGAAGLHDRAAADESRVPVAFRGTIAGASDLRPSDLMISIEPDQAWVDAHVDPESSGSIHESVLPTSAITTDGADYEVRLDPASVPPSDITRYGLVTMTVSAENSAGTAYATDVASIRAVLVPDGSYAWVDPLTPSEIIDPGAGGVPVATSRAFVAGAGRHGRFHPTTMWVRAPRAPVALDIRRFTGRGSLAPALAAARAAGQSARLAAAVSGDDDGTVERTELIADPVYDVSKCEPGPGGNGAGVVRGASRKVMTTIGTTFPVDSDKSKINFNDSQSNTTVFQAKMGVGYQDGTGPVQQDSHLKAMDRAWGFDWIYRDYNRAFQVEQVYQHITNWGDRCPGDPNGPYFQTWEPMQYTGGQTVLTDIATPYYRNCAKQGEEGVWMKALASSDAYDNNTGVRISDWIGINLESVRSYNQSSQLLYKINKTPHWLCGSNRDPAHAQKVMDSQSDLSD